MKAILQSVVENNPEDWIIIRLPKIMNMELYEEMKRCEATNTIIGKAIRRADQEVFFIEEDEWKPTYADNS